MRKLRNLSPAGSSACSGSPQNLQIPYISQSPRWPTGCESVSAVMLLHFLGYSISVDDFIEHVLEKREFEERDGILYGPDPRKAFCGSPYREDAFGCYAPVICRALNRVFGDRFEAKDETGKSMEYLLETYIDQGMPVVFWACIDMREPIVGPRWRLYDTDEMFTWISNEHCMLLVGYDADSYYFNDPHENNGVVRYPKDLVEDRHAAQYRMAVGVKARERNGSCLG